jgi:hypothetical protein
MHRAMPGTVRAFIVAAVIAHPAVASATFSIIARDPATGEIGIAVASKSSPCDLP